MNTETDKGFIIRRAGIKVTDETAALRWARQQAFVSDSSDGPLAWTEDGPLGIPGMACVLGDFAASMSPADYAKVFAGSHPFLYKLMRAWLEGQIAANTKTNEEAREKLALYRDKLIAAGVHASELQPSPVQPNESILQFFDYEHLPPHLREVSALFGELALRLVDILPRNPERTVALRKLLEGKDAAVRARLFK